MLHSDNSYACLRDNDSVCIIFKGNNKTHTHAHAHTRARTHARTRKRAAHTNAHIFDTGIHV